MVEKILLAQLQLLVITVQQEKSLVLESVGLPGFIKFGQERVIFHPFENGAGLKLSGKDARQAGLADTDGPLDNDVFRLRHPKGESTQSRENCLGDIHQ